MKDQILKILNEKLKKRKGAEDLIYYLEHGTDFFTAPASTIYHSNIEGGLALHSLNVYNLLKEKVERYKLDIKEDTIAICGLLHDVCKTSFYVKGKKWIKPNGVWEQKEVWEVKDSFPAGHGEKSVFILQRFIMLTNEEMLVIRWHMMAYDPSIHFIYPNGYAFKQAQKENKLITLLANSDTESTFLLEKICNT